MYENFYQKNLQTGDYVIDVALDDYMDFFHEWDNDTFKKRDMHPELAEFLNICSEYIPLKKKIEISFCIANERQDDNKEKMIVESYKNYYSFYNKVGEKKIKGHLIKAFILTIVSLTFILFHEVLSNILGETLWPTLFLEGFMVGGWAFMWEAIHVITFQRHELVIRNKEVKRFLKAPIIFEYKK